MSFMKYNSAQIIDRKARLEAELQRDGAFARIDAAKQACGDHYGEGDTLPQAIERIRGLLRGTVASRDRLRTELDLERKLAADRLERASKIEAGHLDTIITLRRERVARDTDAAALQKRFEEKWQSEFDRVDRKATDQSHRLELMQNEAAIEAKIIAEQRGHIDRLMAEAKVRNTESGLGKVSVEPCRYTIAAGDIVYLRSGSPPLTVESNQGSGNQVTCTWWSNGTTTRATFVLAALTKVKPS